FDAEATDGFGPTDLYIVGGNGHVWQLVDDRWIMQDVPINSNLNAVKCAPNGLTYAAGSNGVLVYGRDDSWDVLLGEQLEDEIWDLEWFRGKLFASTMEAVYVLENNNWTAVQFGNDTPVTCYQLSASESVLWSNGEYDIWEFNGQRWSRLI
ncbi:MAG: hypothetical protein ABI612_19465, partial [Betaproteobacteria bacterium]